MDATMMQMALAARTGAIEAAYKMQTLGEALKSAKITYTADGRNFRIPVNSKSDGKDLDLMVNWQFLMPGLCHFPSYETWLDVRGTTEEVSDDDLEYGDPRKFSNVDEIVAEAQRLGVTTSN